jgi:hypothetical protein
LTDAVGLNDKLVPLMALNLEQARKNRLEGGFYMHFGYLFGL